MTTRYLQFYTTRLCAVIFLYKIRSRLVFFFPISSSSFSEALSFFEMLLWTSQTVLRYQFNFETRLMIAVDSCFLKYIIFYGRFYFVFFVLIQSFIFMCLFFVGYVMFVPVCPFEEYRYNYFWLQLNLYLLACHSSSECCPVKSVIGIQGQPRLLVFFSLFFFFRIVLNFIAFISVQELILAFFFSSTSTSLSSSISYSSYSTSSFSPSSTSSYTSPSSTTSSSPLIL